MDLCEKRSIAAQIAPKLRMMCSREGLAGVKVDFERTKAYISATVDNVLSAYKGGPETIYVENVGTFSVYPVYPGATFAGKIAIVTGSAQGFGAGIAEYLAENGAKVCVADMNEAGAKAKAAEISEKYGIEAIAVSANVTDEQSVREMVEATVCAFGGLDIFVNNAGIVRAGSLEEMTKQNFELVTSVDYTAFFICTKYAVQPMKLQREIAPEYMADVIEINSKSGLEGSNKNFAYAGAKFGGIGLTQSFALELAPFGIKVNAIWPGNLLDGPLWSDPEKGLFVQYLNAGKVPGAKTIADVRAFYESKVPLGRGCRVEDVTRAICYIVEQKYETGQAIPVTGGQTMLN